MKKQKEFKKEFLWLDMRYPKIAKSIWNWIVKKDKQQKEDIIKMFEETTTRGLVYDGRRSKEIIDKL